MKKNIPFVIIMSVFMAACAVITVISVRDEPQYVRVVPNEAADSDESAANDVLIEKININTATAEELQTLSGIGEVRALAIIAYREKHGEFLYIEELMEIDGIGPTVFENIEEFICID